MLANHKAHIALPSIDHKVHHLLYNGYTTSLSPFSLHIITYQGYFSSSHYQILLKFRYIKRKNLVHAWYTFSSFYLRENYNWLYYSSQVHLHISVF